MLIASVLGQPPRCKIFHKMTRALQSVRVESLDAHNDTRPHIPETGLMLKTAHESLSAALVQNQGCACISLCPTPSTLCEHVKALVGYHVLSQMSTPILGALAAA